jgi:hypothetical protein
VVRTRLTSLGFWSRTVFRLTQTHRQVSSVMRSTSPTTSPRIGATTDTELWSTERVNASWTGTRGAKRLRNAYKPLTIARQNANTSATFRPYNRLRGATRPHRGPHARPTRGTRPRELATGGTGMPEMAEMKVTNTAEATQVPETGIGPTPRSSGEDRKEVHTASSGNPEAPRWNRTGTIRRPSHGGRSAR